MDIDVSLVYFYVKSHLIHGHHLWNVLSLIGRGASIINGATSSSQPTQPRLKTSSYSPGWSDV